MKANFLRLALLTLGLACLTPAAFAGPGAAPMLVMYDGQMMMLTPMTRDMTFKSGTKVSMSGMVTMKSGKTMKLHDMEMVSASGKVMSPAALHAHGG